MPNDDPNIEHGNPGFLFPRKPRFGFVNRKDLVFYRQGLENER